MKSYATRLAPAISPILLSRVTLALRHGRGRGIGFLQVDAPVAQLLERNGDAGHRAAHEGAGAYHAEIAVEIFDIGLAGHRGRTIGTIEQVRLRLLRQSSASSKFVKVSGRPPTRNNGPQSAQHNHSAATAKPSYF